MGTCGTFVSVNSTNLVRHDTEAHYPPKYANSQIYSSCANMQFNFKMCDSIDTILFLRPTLIFFFMCEISSVLFQPFCVLRPEHETF